MAGQSCYFVFEREGLEAIAKPRIWYSFSVPGPKGLEGATKVYGKRRNEKRIYVAIKKKVYK